MNTPSMAQESYIPRMVPPLSAQARQEDAQGDQPGERDTPGKARCTTKTA